MNVDLFHDPDYEHEWICSNGSVKDRIWLNMYSRKGWMLSFLEDERGDSRFTVRLSGAAMYDEETESWNNYMESEVVRTDSFADALVALVEMAQSVGLESVSEAGVVLDER